MRSRPFLAGEAAELLLPHVQRLFANRVKKVQAYPLNFALASDADKVLATLADNPDAGIEAIMPEVQRLIYERYVQAIMTFEMLRHEEIGRVDRAATHDELLSFVIRNWLVGMPRQQQSDN